MLCSWFSSTETHAVQVIMPPRFPHPDPLSCCTEYTTKAFLSQPLAWGRLGDCPVTMTSWCRDRKACSSTCLCKRCGPIWLSYKMIDNSLNITLLFEMMDWMKKVFASEWALYKLLGVTGKGSSILSQLEQPLISPGTPSLNLTFSTPLIKVPWGSIQLYCRNSGSWCYS